MADLSKSVLGAYQPLWMADISRYVPIPMEFPTLMGPDTSWMGFVLDVTSGG